MSLQVRGVPEYGDRIVSLYVYEPGGHDPIRLEVTREAIDKFCEARGIAFDENAFPGDLMEAILLVGDELIDDAPAGTQAVRIVSNKLNR